MEKHNGKHSVKSPLQVNAINSGCRLLLRRRVEPLQKLTGVLLFFTVFSYSLSYFNLEIQIAALVQIQHQHKTLYKFSEFIELISYFSLVLRFRSRNSDFYRNFIVTSLFDLGLTSNFILELNIII